MMRAFSSIKKLFIPGPDSPTSYPILATNIFFVLVLQSLKWRENVISYAIIIKIKIEKTLKFRTEEKCRLILNNDCYLKYKETPIKPYLHIKNINTITKKSRCFIMKKKFNNLRYNSILFYGSAGFSLFQILKISLT